MTGRIGRTSDLILLVGLLGLFVWSIQGKTCSSKAQCQPDVTCKVIAWFCNGSDYTEPATPAPVSESKRCCEYLNSCGNETIVAGWVAFRNTTVEVESMPYSVEWLDTYVTEGNATLPSIIKSAYVGSWSTLKKAYMEFPAQMFVAEPTNSCTVDGEPKWPEWYQVTISVMANGLSDSTLEIEDDREKECLCDAIWDCENNTCVVKTENVTVTDADLGKTDGDIEEKVGLYCNQYLSASNYTASTFFSLGFEPANAELDAWQYNTSVEGGWAPELDDTEMWIKIHLPEDMAVSGIVTQGVALNAERRVDLFTVEYLDSSSAGDSIGASQVFKAGARLDTKMTNYFPRPVKANEIKILIDKPCDPYYVGLRVQLLGCPVCSADVDCTEQSNGVCEVTDKFCLYEDMTGAPTTNTQDMTTGATTEKTTVTTPPVYQTSEDTTSMPVGTTSAAVKTIGNKIDEATSHLSPEEKDKLTQLILPDYDDIGTVQNVNLTSDTIKSGLDVIRNITTVANTTQNAELQKEILIGGWNFMVTVSQGDSAFVSGTNKTIDKGLLKDYLEVASLILDEDRKEAWGEVEKETSAGPLGIVSSVEDILFDIADALNAEDDDITIKESNLEGVLSVVKNSEVSGSGFKTHLSSDPSNGVKPSVTIDAAAFKGIRNLKPNDSLVVVVLKFSSIEEVLNSDKVQDNTEEPDKKRLASDIMSIQVVAGGTAHSIPLEFTLGHSGSQLNEDPKCSFWKPETYGNKLAGSWQRNGCMYLEENVCKCDHMTNFAILMWLGEDGPTSGIGDIISKVGCFVSIAALAVALALLLYLKSSLSSERVIIHLHLMSVTFIALVIFVAGVETKDKTLCTVVTIALHFFFMAMFSWMLVEGIHLYRKVISVFESEKPRMWVYFLIGWGIPILVVGIGTPIFISSYGKEGVCWLNVKDGSIWVFMGPIIPTILVNLVVLIMVSRIVMSASKLQQEKPAFSSVKAGLRSSLLLLPILGVTWIIGYFAHLDEALAIAFAALNSFQGFFMALFHCFMSSEINSALKQKIKHVKDSSMGGASTMDSQVSKPAMFTTGIRKVKVSPSQTDDTDGF